MFIKSISYWSFPGGLEGIRPVGDVFSLAKKAGFEAVEVALSPAGDLGLDFTEKKAADIRKAASDADVRISSVATGLFWGKSLTADDPSVRAEALEIGRKLIDAAAWLEAGAVLVIPGAVDVFFDPSIPVVPYDTVHKRAGEAIAALLPRAAAAKIVLGLENVWNKFLVDPWSMRHFIDQFQSPWVGSYLDVGNCMLTGYPEQWIRILGNRIARVHLKDFRRSVGTADGFVDILSGDANWPEIMRALKEVGYDGFLTAEMIPLYRHFPEVLIGNTSRAIDAILGRGAAG
jgi:hexulose-6-phosphate isomerase